MKKYTIQNLYKPELSKNSAESAVAYESILPSTKITSTHLESKNKAQFTSNLKSTRQQQTIDPNVSQVVAISNSNSKSRLIINCDFDVIPQKPTYPDELPEDNVEAVLYLMNKE